MTQVLPAVVKIPTKSPQPACGKGGRAARRAKARGAASGRFLASGTGRAGTRGGGEVIELEHSITVYPAREDGGRWRAVWYENGERQQCEAASEEKLTARLEKVAERLAADAPNMTRQDQAQGADRRRHRQPSLCRAGAEAWAAGLRPAVLAAARLRSRHSAQQGWAGSRTSSPA